MEKFENWKEKTLGIYVYPISPGYAYEIHINYWDMKTDILTANASLYIAECWQHKDGTKTVERECLLDSVPVMACIGKTIEDNKENNTTS
jgi:hypothetical protein|nr:MAG TPA: hypothetical protein [Caudoviricetes sp.]